MKYAESFRKRDDISNRITSKVKYDSCSVNYFPDDLIFSSFDVLLLVGNKSKHVKDSEHIQHQVD